MGYGLEVDETNNKRKEEKMKTTEWILREAEGAMLDGCEKDCDDLIKEYWDLRKKMPQPMYYADDMAQWIVEENKWNRRSEAQEY